MTAEHHHHIEGLLHLHDKTGQPIDSGSELLHRIDGTLRLARHVFPDTQRLMPGEWTRAQLTFVRPDALERAFWPGRELDVHRGTEQVGTLRVTEVLSLALAGNPPPVRAPAPSGTPSRMGSVIFLALVYLLAAAPTVRLAIEAYTPCVTNFEGGCGMARGLAALISLLPAAGTSGLGIVLARQLARQPAILKRMPAVSLAAGLLWLAPLGYLLFTLYALFH